MWSAVLERVARRSGYLFKNASSIKQGVAVHLYRKTILLYAMMLLEMEEFRLGRHVESNRDRDERSTYYYWGRGQSGMMNEVKIQ